MYNGLTLKSILSQPTLYNVIVECTTLVLSLMHELPFYHNGAVLHINILYFIEMCLEWIFNFVDMPWNVIFVFASCINLKTPLCQINITIFTVQ